MASSFRSGFTIVELIITIVVIGILTTVTAVGYQGISERGRNTIRNQEALSVYKIITTASITGDLEGIDTPGKYCLSDSNPERRPNGEPKCGEDPSGDPAEPRAIYSQELIDSLKLTSSRLPYSHKVESWKSEGYVYHGPTLERWHWVDQNGDDVHAILHWWLEGRDKDCEMSGLIRFDEAEEVVFPSPSTKYSYTDAKAIYCYVQVHLSNPL